MQKITENKPNIYWGGSVAATTGDFASRGHDGKTHLPHLMNTKAGANRHDPMNRAVFEVSLHFLHNCKVCLVLMLLP